MTAEQAQSARARDIGRARPRLLSGGRIRSVSDFLKLDLDTRVRMFEEMTPLECAQLFHDWAFWARPDQAPPEGDWIIWLILAGRGAGKTRAGAEAVRHWINTYPIVNLIGATLADARDIMVRGESGILACCRRDERPQFHATDLRLEWPNGAVSMLFSAEEPDRLRGKQHMKLWCDELAAWRQPDAFDQAMLGLRLGDKPQAVITTTPRRTKIIKALSAGEDTIVTRGSTFDNKAHLARAFLERITARYKGRAIGRQECSPKLSRRRRAPCGRGRCSSVNALHRKPRRRNSPRSWSRLTRRRARDRNPTNAGSIVAAKAQNGLFYVLADLTSQGETPGAWGARVGAAFRGFKANRVVAEINQGGDMVTEGCAKASPTCQCARFTRRAANSCAPSRSRRPTSAGSSFTPGRLRSSRTNFCAFDARFRRPPLGFSPDRADALVWALADLLGVGRASTGGMYEFWTKHIICGSKGDLAYSPECDGPSHCKPGQFAAGRIEMTGHRVK